MGLPVKDGVGGVHANSRIWSSHVKMRGKMEVQTTQKFPSPFCSFVLTPFPTDCKFYSTRFFVAVTNRYTYCVIIFKLQLTLKFFSGNSSVITTTHNKKSTVKDCEFCALNTQRTQRYILVSFTVVYLNRVR